MGGAEEQGGRCAALFVMSFLRHEEIYRSDVGLGHAESRSCGLPPALIGLDEFPVGYSLAGCSPADPASALPTGEHSAVNSSRRSMIFHRTANSVLTVCLTSGGRSSRNFIGLSFMCPRPRPTAPSCALSRVRLKDLLGPADWGEPNRFRQVPLTANVPALCRSLD